MSLDDSFGLAAQVGVNYMINERWFVNASVRWIDIDTEATFNLNSVEGRVGSFEIDPMVTMGSIGYRL